jgi:hypothetical protein
MTRAVRWFLFGGVGLVTLAGCGKSWMQYAQREPWRREAEVACLGSGTVREGVNIVRAQPIDGPGVCGAAFPLKVAALGESPALGFAEEVIRPPGAIPGAAPGTARPVAPPRWPVAVPQYRAPPSSEPQYRWQRGPDPYDYPRQVEEPQYRAQPVEPQYHAQPVESPYRAPPVPRYVPPSEIGAPISLNPPAVESRTSPSGIQQAPLAPPDMGAPRAYPQSDPGYRPAPARRGRSAGGNVDYEEELPPYARPGAAPIPQQPPSRPLPALGPRRGLPVLATPVEVKPTATLACPIVSALDRWIVDSVQPAAQKWFGRPVVEIRQISAYSCRGMNGQPGARISEHAFGNALDIAAFVLADGHRVTVKDGWRGSPEEQGFLRDVQAAACDQFTTVLAPGSNQFHYDHIHVDLMRRDSGRRICQPGAVDGELVAARARRSPALAGRQFEPPPTRRYDPPLDPNNDPFAWRGDTRRGDITGSVGAVPLSRQAKAEDDLDWVEEPGPRPAIDWSDRHRVR